VDGLWSAGVSPLDEWANLDRVPGSKITATLLDEGSSGATAASYLTNSVTPAANKLLLLVVTNGLSGGASVVNTVTGQGVTWVLVDQAAQSNVRVSVFRAMGTPTTGQLTIDFNAVSQTNCIWSLVQFDKVNTGGTNGSGAVVQSKNGTGTGTPSPSVTLTVPVGAGNATFGAVCENSTTNAMTAGATFVRLGTQLSVATPSNGRLAEWSAAGANPVSVGFASGAFQFSMVGIELKAA
jgi:hypothetical protein